jgi:hypothetical protein
MSNHKARTWDHRENKHLNPKLLLLDHHHLDGLQKLHSWCWRRWYPCVFKSCFIIKFSNLYIKYIKTYIYISDTSYINLYFNQFWISSLFYNILVNAMRMENIRIDLRIFFIIKLNLKNLVGAMTPTIKIFWLLNHICDKKS